jgi:hypothetical protein
MPIFVIDPDAVNQRPDPVRIQPETDTQNWIK